MSTASRDLLVRGSAAARVGDEKEARFFLEWLLTLDADSEERLEAQYWLAKVTSDAEEKKHLLEEILSAQPFHMLARREWMILQGKLSPDEIINPNNIPIDKDQPVGINSERYICPKCGGRMVFAPDGASLTCEYCEVKERQEQKAPDGESDFFLSMATLKGHRQPHGHSSFTCQACNASFILADTQLSMTCPYCKSVYVKIIPDTDTNTGPSAIFPARLTKNAAINSLQQWLKQKADPRATLQPVMTGVYLPIWWFELGGLLHYSYMVSEKNKPAKKIIGSQPILRQDVCVPACKHHQEELEQIIGTLHFEEMLDYRPEYVADWLAETYQVTLAEASLIARQIAFKLEKAQANLSIPNIAEDISFSSHEMFVVLYQLVLYPVWFAEITYQSEADTYTIDALNGKLIMKKEGNSSFWDRLMNFGKD